MPARSYSALVLCTLRLYLYRTCSLCILCSILWTLGSPTEPCTLYSPSLLLLFLSFFLFVLILTRQNQKRTHTSGISRGGAPLSAYFLPRRRLRFPTVCVPPPPSPKKKICYSPRRKKNFGVRSNPVLLLFKSTAYSKKMSSTLCS